MLGESVAVYLDAGPARQGEPSTIIDCTGEAPVTLRLGAIRQADIDAALLPVDDVVVADEGEDEAHDAEAEADADAGADGADADGGAEGAEGAEVAEPATGAVLVDGTGDDPSDGTPHSAVEDTVDEWHDVAQDARPDVPADPPEPSPSADVLGERRDVSTDERRADGGAPTQ
jgi:hypothetical protein